MPSLPFCFHVLSPKKNTLLWELAHPHFLGTSYLFGTMHVQDIRAFGKWELAQEKIRECDALALEFDLDDRGLPASFSSTVLPNGLLLYDLFPKKKYRKLRRTFLKATGFDIGLAPRTLPFLLMGNLSAQLLQQDMPTSLDEQLWAFAKSEGKQLLGIETLNSQLEVLAKIPVEIQVKMLLDMGRNISTHRKQLLRLADLYHREDLVRLHRSVKKQAGSLRKIMLYKRNRAMASRVFEVAGSKKVFAAIGAGHLGGGKGVLRLLKKKGVKVRPVSASPM